MIQYNTSMYDKLHELFGLAYPLHTQIFGDWHDMSRPVIVLIHGIGVNHNIWQGVLNQLGDQPVLAVDLLGFGQSRKPAWPDYTLTDHARALRKTVRHAAPLRQVILCGHSLGTLVAIEYTKLFPRRVQQLVLCSPPIYLPRDIAKRPLREALLKTIGKGFLKAINASPKLIGAVNQYKRTQKNFHVSREGFSPYAKTAHNSILLQTSLSDACNLPPLPITILYGTLDAVMIPKHFKAIQRRRRNVVIETAITGHEIRKRYAKLITKHLKQ